MKKYSGLSYKHIKKYCSMDNLLFNTTEELQPLKRIMGQEKGEEAMEFGLEIDNPSYNIFISGSKGTGRTTYTKDIVERIAKTRRVPNDWCYVYSFENKGKAMAINLPAGMGKALQNDMEELIEDLLVQVPQAFNSDDYDRRKNEILKQYQEQKNRLLQHLTDSAEEKQISIKNTSAGFVFVPLKNGEEISEEELKQINEEEAKKIEKQLEVLQEKALDTLLKLKKLERLAKRRLLQLEMKVGLFVVKPLIHDLVIKYCECGKVVDYLGRVERDIIENIHQFVYNEEIIEEKSNQIEEDFVKKYKVNVLVDNSKVEGAPVIIEFNPTLNRLTGKIEYENVNGVLRTDFLHIKPGAIHLANGGYLILEARQLLENIYSWETLKRILYTKEITVENMGIQLGGVDVTSLKLEPIPIDLKVILIGSEKLYHLLHHYDEDFEKYFKVLVDFDEEMQRTENTEKQMATFIGSYVKTQKLKHLNAAAVAGLIEYSCRLASSQNKLTTRFNKIIEIIIEANQWAKKDKSPLVTSKHINKAIDKKWSRLNKYQEKIEEMFTAEKILIDVEGKKIGVVNGVSVISLGEYTFGKPNVITVTSSIGREGIINIERETNLSGDIYDKGIMILTGFLMQNFAQDEILSVSARICFEQSYSGVDGDSASSTELYALLSSIAGIPLKQYIAATGSINQRGYIQPVGSVTEKVEGFYRLCKKRGFTGTQGVIIPYQNIENLMVLDELVEAVENGYFHIYPIKHIEEGLEIMTDETCNKIYQEIRKKLKYYSDIIRKD